MPSTLDAPPARRPERASGLKPSHRGISLGRILGLEVTLDTSWLVIFALISFSLYSSLANDYPGRPMAYYWIGALSASVVFFASILIHEMSHSLVARARGLDVQGITLFFFGGVSRLKNEPKKASDEFLMAVVGPLTSALLGVVFLGVKRLLPSGTMGSGLVGWLGFINLALAAFNLLPGFPLDGGRVFRAIAWAFTGNLMKATRMASRAGSTIAYGMIFWGLLQAFFYNHLMNGLWFGFLGWFLLSAAQQSVAQLELGRILDLLRVSEVMRSECVRVPPDESVARFVEEHVLRTGERCFLVSGDDDTLLGLVTLHEVKSLPRESWSTTAIREVMVPLDRLRSLGPDRPLSEALGLMNEGSVNQLPVVEGTALRGLVTREDLLRRLAIHLELGPERNA